MFKKDVSKTGDTERTRVKEWKITSQEITSQKKVLINF